MRALWTQFTQKIADWTARLAMFFTRKHRPFRARIIKRDILGAYRQTLDAQERKNALTQRFLSRSVDFETLHDWGVKDQHLHECRGNARACQYVLRPLYRCFGFDFCVVVDEVRTRAEYPRVVDRMAGAIRRFGFACRRSRTRDLLLCPFDT